MGTQQILMIILSVIVVGTAIAAGIQMFDKQLEKQTKLALANECMRLMSQSYAYFRTPVAMGGGGNGKNPSSNPPGQPLATDLLKLTQYLDRSAAPASSGGGYSFTNLLGTFQVRIVATNGVGDDRLRISAVSAANEAWSGWIDFWLQGPTGPGHTPPAPSW